MNTCMNLFDCISNHLTYVPNLYKFIIRILFEFVLKYVHCRTAAHCRTARQLHTTTLPHTAARYCAHCWTAAHCRMHCHTLPRALPHTAACTAALVHAQPHISVCIATHGRTGVRSAARCRTLHLFECQPAAQCTPHIVTLIAVCDCVLCAVCGVRCAAVRHSNSCSVQQCAAECTPVSGSAAVWSAECGCRAVCAAVCGCPVVRQCAAARQCACFQINLKHTSINSYKL
jgi:hypothetical protein